MSGAALDIAIVGLGPKGMYALERLLEHIHRADRCADARAGRVRITAFEPSTPGCGPNYDPSQPVFLRMNFAASQIDAWPDGATGVPRAKRLDFVEWRSRVAPEHGDDEYPPRAQVGRYLGWCLDRMLAHRSSRVDWTFVPRKVTVIERAADGWLVASPERRRRFDEVIVCTGHRRKDIASATSGAGALPVVPVFPIGALLEDHPLAPASAVAVRGFALSFIDAALALTEGRGGTFAPGRNGYELRYLPGGREPRTIVPFSRSGLPMAAKPPPGRLGRGDEVERATALARARVLGLEPGFSVDLDLMTVVADLAQEIGTSSGARAPGPVSQVAESIRRSVAIAEGVTPPDPESCLGEAWRRAYPAIVERLGHGGLADDQYRPYRRLARSMERIAFGPPPVNAAKLLALAEAGIVDLERTGVAPGTQIDGLVDAVLAEPGADRSDPGPIGTLLRAGVVTLDGRRGVRVDAAARCIGPDGRRVAGLACAGRPTEDWVIGNDTLSRRLHPELDLWARSVAARASADAPPAPAALPPRLPVRGGGRG